MTGRLANAPVATTDGRVSQSSALIQTGSQAAGEPETESSAAVPQQTPQQQPLQQPTVTSGQSGVVSSGAVAKNSLAASEIGTTSQKSASPSAVSSSEPDLLNQAAVLCAKPPEKPKAHKEDITLGQGNAANGVTVAGNDPLIAASNPEPVASTASSVVPVDVGETTAALTTKSRVSGKADSSSDLAFVVKIQGISPIVDAIAQSNSDLNAPLDLSNPTTQIATTAFSPPMTGTASFSGAKLSPKRSFNAESGPAGLTTLASTTPGAGLSSAHSDDDVPEAEESMPVAAVAEDQPISTQPVKTIQVQITGADDQKVDLKLVEKSGSLTMSVRSTDSSLTKVLQQNLPDLSTRLNDQQIKAEWWRPDAQQPETQRNSGGSSGNTNNPANQDQGGQNKGNSGQQGWRGNPQPDWVEKHNLSRKSNQNGTNFSWQL